MRILIADDDPFSRRVLKKMLAPWGEAEFAVDGMDVLARFKEALEKDDLYQLVCLDINMPKLDGQRAVEMIREMEPKEAPKAVVFMISGDSTADNVIHAKVKGHCAAFLVKPIDKDRLAAALVEAGLAEHGDRPG